MTTTLEQFSDLANEYTVIPVWKERVADYITPVAAFTRVVGDGDGFLLESVEHGRKVEPVVIHRKKSITYS